MPNSGPGRGNIEIEIYGMEGIPEADLKVGRVYVCLQSLCDLKCMPEADLQEYT